MDYRTEQLVLRSVTEDDLAEVARTWPSDHRPVSEAEARGAIDYMRRNHARNAKGRVCHLCLAVCGADDPNTIMGWCGLDGRRSRSEPELFILLDEKFRNRGPLKTIAAAGEMNFGQICLAKGAGCLAGSQGFCKAKMAEIQPPAGDESF